MKLRVSLLLNDRKISLHFSRSAVCRIRNIRIYLCFSLNAICLTMNTFISPSFSLNALCQTKNIQIVVYFSLNALCRTRRNIQIVVCFLLNALCQQGGIYKFFFNFRSTRFAKQGIHNAVFLLSLSYNALWLYAKHEIYRFLYAFRLAHFVEQGMNRFLLTSRKSHGNVKQRKGWIDY